MRNILTVSNLSVQYPFSDNPTIKDLSFSMKQGETLLVVGASGCGKSSLALAIAGLIPRTIEAQQSGNIHLDGTDISELAPGETCQRIGIVFQDPEAQFCMLTVEDEIAFGLENIGLSRDVIEARIDEALAMVQLTQHKKTLVHRLSGGMKQRVALACVLALRPSLLILDEPTANLDPAATEDFFLLLENLTSQRQYSIILIEHKLEQAVSLVDRVMLMADGKISAHSSPEEVFASENQTLKDSGVWQPYASEIAGRLEVMGHKFTPHPLTVSQLLNRKFSPQETSALFQLVKSGGKPGAPVENIALEFNNVSFNYKAPFSSVQVLKDINWQIKPGSFVALLGENGAGKSTLSRIALGLLKPSKGEVELFGKSVKTMARRRIASLAGLVFQNPEHQFVTDSVWEEIAYSLKLTDTPGPQIPDKVDELLEEFSLLHKADSNPFTLSQGEKRRLSVASMLATDQKLLILDEPSFGQDHTNTYKLMNLVRERQQAGCTIIMITHDMRLVWEYATDVALLSQKTLKYTGPVKGLFSQQQLLQQSSLKQPLALSILEQLLPQQKVGVAGV